MPLLQLFGLPDNAEPVIGPVVGFIGADKVREILLGIIERKSGK
ncbi:phage holin family protein [Enterobacter kobei]